MAHNVGEDSPDPILASAALTPLVSAVQCPACREQINPQAKLCKHCKADLTWKRYLPIGSTTLAMATGLIAVSATVVPPLVRTLEVQNSRISALLIGAGQRSKAFLLVSNDGPRIGAISSVVTVTQEDRVVAQVKLEVNPPQGVVFVQPHSTQQVVLGWEVTPGVAKAYQELRNAYAQKRPPGYRCAMDLKVVNANAMETHIFQTFDCERIKGAWDEYFEQSK
ncbi:hypothetical protein QTH97_36340 [Variovorax sp. J22R24]|uniref:hypothetical protein n=1 Tax=Variovorax gracilis TaxID=3053502 RepID=UPI002577492E|nr:hypothetical protein [Variovorax sp. J22R24]MDM0110402.1 hypothetical protein [Variovorax sp. J22R24]